MKKYEKLGSSDSHPLPKPKQSYKSNIISGLKLNHKVKSSVSVFIGILILNFKTAAQIILGEKKPQKESSRVSFVGFKKDFGWMNGECFIGGTQRKYQRKSRVCLCSAQLVFFLSLLSYCTYFLEQVIIGLLMGPQRRVKCAIQE